MAAAAALENARQAAVDARLKRHSDAVRSHAESLTDVEEKLSYYERTMLAGSRAIQAQNAKQTRILEWVRVLSPACVALTALISALIHACH